MSNVEHSTSDASSGRILIIDDLASVRRLLRVALEVAEFEVVESETLACAESCLRRVRIDAAVLDLQCAETCLHVLRRLRSQPRLDALPILFLAGEDDDDLRWKALSSGADWFMLRPLSMFELQDRVYDFVTRGRCRLRAVPTQRRERRQRRLAG